MYPKEAKEEANVSTSPEASDISTPADWDEEGDVGIYSVTDEDQFFGNWKSELFSFNSEQIDLFFPYV